MKLNTERWDAENAGRRRGVAGRAGSFVPGDDYDPADYAGPAPKGWPPFDPNDPLLVALRDQTERARRAGR